MNKRPARNQVEGSVVMGVGTALFEKRSYDRRGCEGRAGLGHEAESIHVARSDSRDGTVVFVMDRF
jgi:xanthine dehydrogenase YagR molybdenum-binding subunit